SLSFIPIIELGPRPVHFHTVRQSREGDFQPNCKSSHVCKSTVLGIDISTAAEGDHRSTGIRGLPEITSFKRSKVRLSIFPKYLRELPVFVLFDFPIEVDELPAEFPCQLTSYGRFARPHKPDQVNPAVFHAAVILTNVGDKNRGQTLISGYSAKGN